MFEKIRANDARFQDIYSIIYNDFKLKNGFSPEEIINKTKSLKGVLEPFSDHGNLGLLKRSGFKDIITFFNGCFKGYLCIK
jgi:tRNA (cmo5U34)-methyltransferase